MNRNKKAFTLIELLVVCAIIGILSAVVLESLSYSQAKARDQNREADLKEIQIDLAQYYEYYEQYPSALSNLSGFVLGGGGNIPTDPQTHASYFYAPYAPSSSGGLNVSYCIGAALETSVPSDNATAACTAEGITNASYDYMQQPPQ